MDPLTILNSELIRALNQVNQARNQVGSLRLYTSPADPDIHDRVTGAYNRLAQAEGILEGLRDDIEVWLKHQDKA